MSARIFASLALVISLLFTAGAQANTITVNSLNFTLQWPTPNPSPPPANGTTISTGNQALSFPLFNPTMGYLTRVDLTFDFTTIYGGAISNFGTAPYTGRIVSNSGTTVRYSMAPFGTLWNYSAPPEGPTIEESVGSFRTSYFRSSPTVGFGSPTISFVNQTDLNQFIGVGNTVNLQASQTYITNLAVSPAQSGVSVSSFQRAFAPRARAVYTFNPFSTPVPSEGGLTFSLAQGPTGGEGQVEPTPLGSRHHNMVTAGPSEPVASESTTARQTFRFQREDGGPQQTLVYINGLLDGLLRADVGGRAEALGIIELYTQSGQFIDRIERLVFADSTHMNNTLVQFQAYERFALPANLLPGNSYELRTELRLKADPRGNGSALADFSHTFDVELSGTLAVPEPASSGLFAIGCLLVSSLARRSKRHN